MIIALFRFIAVVVLCLTFGCVAPAPVETQQDAVNEQPAAAAADEAPAPQLF